MKHFFLGGLLVGDRMSILFFTKRFCNRIEKSTEYLIEELMKQADVVVWEYDGNLNDILSTIGFKPSFILLNDLKRDYCPCISGLSSSPVPVGSIFHEVKYKPYRRKQFYERENIQHLFVHYRDASLRFLPEFKERYIWFPHHVPLSIFKDYEEPRTINILMLGSMLKKVYPKRVAFYEQLKNEPGFMYREHPGYHELPASSTELHGEAYARLIARAKMFVTCDSIEKLPVMKYFESLACQTLLLASGSKELQDLGFIDGETYVEVNEDNVVEKANFYLANQAERERIIENGYQLIKARHSTEKRVRDLLKRIQQICENHI